MYALWYWHYSPPGRVDKQPGEAVPKEMTSKGSEYEVPAEFLEDLQVAKVALRAEKAATELAQVTGKQDGGNNPTLGKRGDRSSDDDDDDEDEPARTGRVKPKGPRYIAPTGEPARSGARGRTARAATTSHSPSPSRARSRRNTRPRRAPPRERSSAESEDDDDEDDAMVDQLAADDDPSRPVTPSATAVSVGGAKSRHALTVPPETRKSSCQWI